jgi:hypothetical protein
MSSMKWFEGPAWVISLYDDDESLLSNVSTNFMDLDTSVRSSFIVSCFIVDSCKWGLLLFNWFILELFPIEVVEFKPNNWEPWPIKKLLVRIACWEKRLISLGPTPLRKVPTFLLLLWACYTIVLGEPAVNKISIDTFGWRWWNKLKLWNSVFSGLKYTVISIQKWVILTFINNNLLWSCLVPIFEAFSLLFVNFLLLIYCSTYFDNRM